MRDSIPERVFPPLRDGTESEISHTFPFPAVCTGPSLDETLRMLKPLAPRYAGAIPESIGKLTNLRILYLGNNALTGA